MEAQCIYPEPFASVLPLHFRQEGAQILRNLHGVIVDKHAGRLLWITPRVEVNNAKLEFDSQSNRRLIVEPNDSD